MGQEPYNRLKIGHLALLRARQNYIRLSTLNVVTKCPRVLHHDPTDSNATRRSRVSDRE